MVLTMVDRTVLAAALLARALLGVGGQSTGSGISKSTYAASDPVAGMEFLLEYLPVTVASDECSNNECNCTWRGERFVVDQGRVALHEKGEGGFGLHLVATEHKSTTGGLTVEAVEAFFDAKVGSMDNFDAFLDYNVHFFAYHEYFDKLYAAFTEGGVATLAVSWPADDQTWYGFFVQVPKTQMILEFSSNRSLALADDATVVLEPRLSATARATATATKQRQLSVAAVSRASSDVAAVEAFYVGGMNATLTLKHDDATVKTRCARWTNGAVDVCFRERSPEATSADFSVAAFESMLHATHHALLRDPNCGLDRWADNHYAIDAPDMDATWILSYLEEHEDARYVCNGASLHYVFDPTGFAIQLDLGINGSAVRCDARTWDADLEPDYSCWGGVCEDAYALAFGAPNASLPAGASSSSTLLAAVDASSSLPSSAGLALLGVAAAGFAVRRARASRGGYAVF